MDAELSAMLGPLNLKPDQLLSSIDTEDVFQCFSIPDMNSISDEEGVGGGKEDDEYEVEEEEEDVEEEEEVRGRKRR